MLLRQTQKFLDQMGFLGKSETARIAALFPGTTLVLTSGKKIFRRTDSMAIAFRRAVGAAAEAKAAQNKIAKTVPLKVVAGSPPAFRSSASSYPRR